jgi:glycosyltransferase involved in cell wall biosynthesis
MVKMIEIDKYENKTWFALPRLDREFFNQFRVTKDYECRNCVVGYVGTLSRRKGILNLIKAIPIIMKKKDCQFLIIGGGPLMETAKNVVQKLQIGKLVNILGFVDYDSLSEYYNRMKICVVPSYAEGIPSTIFEAMACGTPILSTSVGGIPDVIKEGENGFLLNSNNPGEIAERVIDLLENPSLLKAVSRTACRQAKENRFECSRSWQEILQNLQKQNPRHRSRIVLTRKIPITSGRN